MVLTVRDNGVGIPPEMIAHVFDMFMQVNKSHSGAQGGLGIGLTLVRNLVEMHGGTVDVASQGVGQGSEFAVRLPLMENAAASSPSSDLPAVPTPGPARTYRVLVVDDNFDAADSLGQMLRLQGHEVKIAHDGPAALELAAAFAPDVALLDIGLPGMNGLELARRLRQLEGLQDILLIAQTGWGQEEDRIRSRHAGFDHHLVKPLGLGSVAGALCNAEIMT